MVAAKIESGSVFRSIGRWGTVSKRAIDPQSVNAILKQRGGDCEPRARGLFRALATVRISDRGSQSRHPAPRSHGAVAPSIGAAGIELLQPCNAAEWEGRAIALLSEWRLHKRAHQASRLARRPTCDFGSWRHSRAPGRCHGHARALHTERLLARSSKIILYCDAGIENAKHRSQAP